MSNYTADAGKLYQSQKINAYSSASKPRGSIDRKASQKFTFQQELV